MPRIMVPRIMVTETHAKPPAGTPEAAPPRREAPPMAVAASCANCGTPVTGPYCASCGECHAENRSRTLGELGQEMVTEHFGLETRLFRTLYELFARPGRPTAEYLGGKRRRYVKPLRLFLFVSALSFLAISVHEPMSFDLESLAAQDPYGNWDAVLEDASEEAGVSRALISERFEARMNRVLPIVNLVGPFLLALLLKLLYLGSGRYYYDHVLFALHFSTLSVILGTLALPLFSGASGLGSMLYMAVSLGGSTVFLYLMQRRVYPEPFGPRLVRFLGLLVGFVVQITIYSVSAFVIALIWLLVFS